MPVVPVATCAVAALSVSSVNVVKDAKVRRGAAQWNRFMGELPVCQ